MEDTTTTTTATAPTPEVEKTMPAVDDRSSASSAANLIITFAKAIQDDANMPVAAMLGQNIHAIVGIRKLNVTNPESGGDVTTGFLSLILDPTPLYLKPPSETLSKEGAKTKAKTVDREEGGKEETAGDEDLGGLDEKKEE